MYQPGYGTEYTENFCWTEEEKNAGSWNQAASGLFNGTGTGQMEPPMGTMQVEHTQAPPPVTMGQTGGTEFYSETYPSVYRETIIKKDERGHYIDPFSTIASKPYGRRLMYDPTHPQKMYASQWSSELADHPGCYAFPTTTGLQPEQPWLKDMAWRAEGEDGKWPTDMWKEWTHVAECPPYDGHSDQPQYSQYKVQVP